MIFSTKNPPLQTSAYNTMFYEKVFLLDLYLYTDNTFCREEHEELPRQSNWTLSDSYRICISLGLGKDTNDGKRLRAFDTWQI